RLLAFGISCQHLAILFHRFRVPAGLLKGDGMAEERLLVIREKAEILVERLQRVFRTPIVNESDAQSQKNVRAARVRGSGSTKRVGGLMPPLQIAVTDADIEICSAVFGIGFGKLSIGARGSFVVANFVLDMAQSGVKAGFALSVFQRLGEKAGSAFQ